MAIDEERLVVSLEARLNDFEKRMKQAERSGTRTYQQLASGSSRATRQMEQDMVRSTVRINQALATTSTHIGELSKAFGIGLAGGIASIGIGGAVAGLRDMTRGIAEMANEARRAGVSLKSFQELRYVADKYRVSVDALTDGLKEMNLRADEFIYTGKGSGAEAFQRLGYSAEELRAKLKDPITLFTEIIGKMGQLQKASRIRIADEIFGGTGGEQFVQLIDQGAEGIRRTIDEANELGVVLSDEVIARAEEIDRKFTIIANTVSSKLKGAIVDATVALTDFINAFHGFQAERGAVLDEKLATLGKERLEVEQQIFELQEKQRKGQVGAGDGILGSSIGESTISEVIEQQKRRLEAISAEEEAILKVVDARKKAAEVADDGAPTVLKEIEINAGGAAKGIKEAEKAARDAKRQFDAFQSTADSLAEALYPGEYARREAEKLLADLEKYGDRLDGFQRSAVQSRIADQFEAARRGVRELEDDSKHSFKEMGESFQTEVGDIFADVFSGGVKSLDDFVDRVISGFARIGEMNMRNAFDMLFGGSKTASVNGGSSRGNSASGIGQLGDWIGSIFSDNRMVSAQNKAVSRAAARVPAQPLEKVMAKVGTTVSDTVSSISSTMTAYAGAIRQLESSGRYDAQGPVVTRGQYAGQRAQGAYGVMPGNIPAWTKELLGYSVSTQEFVKSRAIQDGVFAQQFGKYIKRFGNELDAASAWLTGQPRARAGNNADDLGTNSAKYVSAFKAALGNQSDFTSAVAVGSEAGLKNGLRDIADGPVVSPGGSGPAPGSAGGGFGNVLGAAFGAFSMGYQSQSPLMGGIGGALSGLGASGAIASAFPALAGVAGPLGLVGGAIAGPIFGKMGSMKKENCK